MNPLRLLLLMIALAACAARAAEPPLVLIERSKAALRSDPESSRSLAQEALQALARAPDPDLQIRAHLLLCDYYSERDPAAAKQQIEQTRDLLPKAGRPGLRAGLLSCGGEMAEVAGDNVQAMALYQQTVTVAEGAGEQELLADALFQRGYLRSLQGEFADGLADLGQAIAIYERLGLPQEAQTSVNGVAILYNRMGDLPNRRDVLARLETLLAAPDRSCALLIVDIDHFKSINDAHGHLVGDDILRAVARALRDVASEPIAMGRLGGEEFVVIEPDGDEVSGRQLAERMIARVRALDLGHLLPGRRVTVSIGLTICAAGDTVTQMLRRAHEALYVAKAGGRDRFVTRVPLPETAGFEPTHVTSTA